MAYDQKCQAFDAATRAKITDFIIYRTKRGQYDYISKADLTKNGNEAVNRSDFQHEICEVKDRRPCG